MASSRFRRSFSLVLEKKNSSSYLVPLADILMKRAQISSTYVLVYYSYRKFIFSITLYCHLLMCILCDTPLEFNYDLN